MLGYQSLGGRGGSGVKRSCDSAVSPSRWYGVVTCYSEQQCSHKHSCDLLHHALHFSKHLHAYLLHRQISSAATFQAPCCRTPFLLSARRCRITAATSKSLRFLHIGTWEALSAAGMFHQKMDGFPRRFKAGEMTSSAGVGQALSAGDEKKRDRFWTSRAGATESNEKTVLGKGRTGPSCTAY